MNHVRNIEWKLEISGEIYSPLSQKKQYLWWIYGNKQLRLLQMIENLSNLWAIFPENNEKIFFTEIESKSRKSNIQEKFSTELFGYREC